MRTMRNLPGSNATQAGGALVMVAFATAVMATLSFSVLALSMAGAKEQRTSKEQMSARFVCEAGLSEAVFELAVSSAANVVVVEQGQVEQPGDVGSEQDPETLGGGSFWVEATPLANMQTRLVATGEVDRAGERIELTVREVVNTKYVWGAFGDVDMAMSSNARVDSYDATLGTYASQAVNSDGSSTYAGTDGDVGSNKDVGLSQNAKVWGDAVPGPTGIANIGVNVVVTGTTLPNSESIPLPPIEVPAIATWGPVTYSGATNAIGPGDIAFDSILVDSNSHVQVTGPARIVVGDFRLNSNATFMIDASAGPVELYVLNDFLLNSNTTLASTDFLPKNLEVLLLSDNIIDPAVTVDLDTVDFNSNARLFGTVYAPDAFVDVNSNFELFGSLVAKKVRLRSNATVHFDESLATTKKDLDSTWEIVCWRLLPYQP
jgi:hypothetical protein